MDRSACRPSWDVAGPAAARPVLFLHAGAWTRKMWLPQTETMAREFHTVAIDLPGHGALSGTPFSMDAAVEEASGAVDREGGGRALVVGISLGGYVAIELAHRFPGKVAGLVLSGCSGENRGLPSWLLAKIYGQALKLWGKEWLPRTHTRNVRLMFPPEIAEPQIEAGFYFFSHGKALLELHDRGFHRMVREYPGPVLILNGELDSPNRKAERALLASTVRGKLLIVPRAGQLCNLQQPYAFTGAVVEFARQIDW